MRKRLIVLAPLVFIGFLLFVAAGGAIVMLLWNWLLPSIAAWPSITFWQALGLLALCRILFGGVAFRGGPRSHIRRRMAERWEQMSPEQRERFRAAMRERCGFGPRVGEHEGS